MRSLHQQIFSSVFKCQACLGVHRCLKTVARQVIGLTVGILADMMKSHDRIPSSLKIHFSYYILSLCVLILFVMLRVMRHLPLLKHFIPWLMVKVATMEMQKETYWESIFTWQMYKSIRDGILLELQKRVRLGDEAHNSELISCNGKSFHNLLDMARGNRPLIVNFGSITCPVFMKRLEEFSQMAKRFGDIADFLIVYVEEAHPSDGWAFKNNIMIRRHQTQEDRCSAARLLQQYVDLPCPLLVDTMKDEANLAYGAAPIRLYIIQEGRAIYAGGAGPTLYRPAEVKTYLENRKARLFELCKRTPVRKSILTSNSRRNSLRAG